MNSTTSELHPLTRFIEALKDSPRESKFLSEIEQARAVRALLEVDLSAIRHNVHVISQLSEGAKLMAVLKRDAYGLGARVLARLLQSCRVQAFAVDNVAEGIELRASGITEPILVIDGDISENAPLAVAHNLMPGIPHENLLLAYERAAERIGDKYPVWLVANVGFNRSGYRDIERFTHFALRARECQHLEVKAVYAHLTNSNGDLQISLAQIEEFRQVVSRAKALFGSGIETSLFASHGLVRWAKMFPTDWVRPGILLYGEHAFLQDSLALETSEAIQKLRPALRLRTRITHLLDFTHSEGVGYGQQHVTRPGQRLATVSIGFGSGYPFRSTKLHALVRNHRVPLFGDVGMDAFQLDVTDIPDIELYDWVTLIGTDGDEHISVHSLAFDAETTPYQLLSGIHCCRSYVDSGDIFL